MKHAGRAEPVSNELISHIEAVMRFPSIEGYNLLDEKIIFPTLLSSIKLVVFSFKQVGFDYNRRYIEAFEARFHNQTSTPIPIYDINFVEYSFLSFLKSLFVENLKKLIPEHRWKNSFVIFGQVKVSLAPFL